MATRWLLGLAGIVVATTLAACSATPGEDLDDSHSAVAAKFDKNTLLKDAELRDSKAMSAEEIQSFLDETPWGHASVLANYEEDGKSAAEIIHAAAEKYEINPLVILVRAQLEQQLIYKKTATDRAISIAFGCGCPHSPVCSPKYEGFANQAECAAGMLSRSMDRATSPKGTASGWKKGEAKVTQDGVTIVPSNAATTALYSYTPVAGEKAGGNKAGVGGNYTHTQIWEKFRIATGYAAPGSARNPTSESAPKDSVLDGGAGQDESDSTPTADAGSGSNGSSSGSNGTTTRDAGTTTRDAGTSSSADASAPSGSSGSSGSSTTTDSTKKGDTNTGTPQDESDDEAILSEGTAPAEDDSPLPKSSSRYTGEEEEATEDELSPRKRASASSCSSTPGHAGSGGFAGLVFAAASLVAARRRRG